MPIDRDNPHLGYIQFDQIRRILMCMDHHVFLLDIDICNYQVHSSIELWVHTDYSGIHLHLHIRSTDFPLFRLYKDIEADWLVYIPHLNHIETDHMDFYIDFHLEHP